MQSLFNFYRPFLVGNIAQRDRASVLGWAHDYDGLLVALSVQGSNTLIEQMHADYQRNSTYVQLYVRSGLRGPNRYAQTHGVHYQIFKAPIPDSSDISMIMLSDTFMGPVEEMNFTHVPYLGVEDFIRRVYYRVKSIVHLPIKPEWASHLYRVGGETMLGMSPLCGVLKQRDEESRDWTASGFEVGYIRNKRESWESLICNGLASGNITI